MPMPRRRQESNFLFGRFSHLTRYLLILIREIAPDRATLPDAKKISGGKYSGITHFQEKVEVEEYIKKIDLPAVFLSPSVRFTLLSSRTNASTDRIV